MGRDSQSKRGIQKPAMDTRRTKRQTPGITHSHEEEELEKRHHRITLDEKSVGHLNEAMIHLNPNIDLINLGNRSGHSLESSNRDSDQEPLIMEDARGKSVQFSQYIEEEDVDHSIEAETVQDDMDVASQEGNINQPLITTDVENVHYDLFSTVELQEIKSLAPFEQKTHRGSVILSPHDQVLLKVAGEYYNNLPDISEPGVILRFLFAWTCHIHNIEISKEDVNMVEAIQYTYSVPIANLTGIIGNLVLTSDILTVDGQLITRSASEYQTYLEESISTLPILRGSLKMIQAIALLLPARIEPVHKLLLDNDEYMSFVNSNACGEKNYLTLNVNVIPLGSTDDHNVVKPIDTSKIDETIRPDVTVPPLVRFGKSHPSTSKYYERQKTTGRETGTTIGKKTMDEVLMGISKKQTVVVTRDTSNFRANAIHEEKIVAMLEAVQKEIIIQRGLLTTLEIKVDRLSTELARSMEASSLAITRTARADLNSREAINKALLVPKSSGLLGILRGGQPTKPLNTADINSIIDRVRNFPMHGDTSESLIKDVKDLMVANNLPVIAASLNDSSLSSKGARHRLLCNINRIPRA